MLLQPFVEEAKSVILKKAKWNTPKWMLMLPFKWNLFGISTGICFIYWGKPSEEHSP